MILVDTNVLLDLVTDDPVWGEWSQRQIRAAVATDELAMLERVRVTFVPTPRPASFLAGKAFQRYRAAGGIRTGVLPDFFLGAHSSGHGFPSPDARQEPLPQLFPHDRVDLAGRLE